jgi:hypothetical protein
MPVLALFAIASVGDFFRVTFPVQKAMDRLNSDRAGLETARGVDNASGGCQ